MTSRRNIAHKKNSLAEGNYGIDPKFSQEYSHGRVARNNGYGIDTLYDPSPVLLAWQRAGWHDADIEAGNRVLNNAS